MKLENGIATWPFSSTQYIQNAIKNVEIHIQKSNQKLPLYTPSPFTIGYRPEIDTSPVLCPTEASYYQSMIGILCWVAELGRIDIMCEVSIMASMMAMPRKGHLDQLYHIFSYLKRKHNSEIVFDPTVPVIDMDQFPKYNWDHTLYKIRVKISLKVHLNQEDLVLRWWLLWIQIMTVTTLLVGQGLDFLLSLTIRQFIGCQRSSQESKLHPLDQNLWH